MRSGPPPLQGGPRRKLRRHSSRRCHRCQRCRPRRRRLRRRRRRRRALRRSLYPWQQPLSPPTHPRGGRRQAAGTTAARTVGGGVQTMATAPRGVAPTGRGRHHRSRRRHLRWRCRPRPDRRAGRRPCPMQRSRKVEGGRWAEAQGGGNGNGQVLAILSAPLPVCVYYIILTCGGGLVATSSAPCDCVLVPSSSLVLCRSLHVTSFAGDRRRGVWAPRHCSSRS